MSSKPDDQTRYAVIVSGLLGSGKSTLGRVVASQLGSPFLDKNAFLDQLFGHEGIGDLDWCQMLNTKSNTLFCDAARAHETVVLVSHWRPPSEPGPSGTSPDWSVK